jgi:phosphoglycerol transferase MdoB-like AlkP superfamily enzyme
MIGYLSAIPFILYFFYFLFKKKFFLTIADCINYAFIILYNFTAFGETCLYREWKAKLSMQALEHFANPEEVFKSASTGLTILFFSLSFFLSWLYIKIYNLKISVKQHHPVHEFNFLKSSWRGILFLVTISAFCIISIRGGLQQIPIQSSDSFFCTTPIANDVAVNPLWNIAFNFMEYKNHLADNPYKDFEQKDADQITRSLFKIEKDTTTQFLNTTKPNIVFILLESWSAYCIKSFGGDDYAPFMDSLSREGIRFMKLYPAGYVSDQGIPAVLSSYPSVSRIAVINESPKSVPLPCISEDLKKYGYQSGFVFGGDLNYGNIRSYVFNKKFDVIKEERDFDGDIPRGKLGIQDKDMAGEFLKTLNSAKAPFVYSWFTLSSHMPYDFPGEKKQLVKAENEYINSIVYADGALKSFFNEAKKQSWYNNTIFVIVADHSHASHKELSVYDAEYHRIPLVLFGNPIDASFKGKVVENVYSQLDIVPTLLKQMKLDEESKQYIWGKNMFNPYTKPFAFYCSYNGSGFISNDGFVGFQQGLKPLIIDSTNGNKSLSDSLSILGKAFQQSVYEDYRLK